MNYEEEKIETVGEAPAETPVVPAKTKALTGFAKLTPEQRSEIARRGQAALKASGKRHTFTKEQAQAASRIGWARKNAKQAG